MPVKLKILFFLTAIIFFACVDRYNPTIGKYENLLVVDGYFTDEEKSHQIKLYYTSDVYSTQKEPVLGALVKIVSDEGDFISFFDNNSSGEYLSTTNVKAEAGKKYKLIVQLNNSTFYETDFQELIASPPIDTVYGEREIRQTWELGEELDGLQFYLETTKNSEQSVFFQWKLTETFEYDAEMLLEALYSGGIKTVTKKDSLFTCWKTSEVTNIFTYSIKYTKDEAVKKFPLLYVGNDTKQLSKRYSLNVKQYVLNEEAYNFWNSIKEQIDNQGTLYSTQPYQLKGNLKNIENSDEVVLGYFVVAGVTEKRIFIDKPGDLVVYRNNCTVNTDMMPLLPKAPPAMWPFYLALNTTNELGVVDISCVDCQVAGGELKKPDFWK